MIPLPKDELSEKCIIGAILYDCQKAMDLLVPCKISPDHFTDTKLQEAYSVSVDKYNSGKPVDLLTVHQALNGRVDHKLLMECIEAMPTIAYVPHYAEKLNDMHIRRSMIKTAQEMAQKAADAETEAEETRSVMELKLAQLTSRHTRTRTVSAILDAQIEKWEAARNHGCIGLQTGFICIDTYLGGLMDSAFIIISGPPGSCKTTFVRNVLENIAMHGTRVSMLSLEQTSEQILGACAARVARQSVFDLNRGWRKTDIEAVKQAKSVIESWPLVVEDQPHTLSDACSWIRREVGKGSKAIVIDYLQRIIPDKHMAKNNDESKIREISTTLANMAKETGVPIVALSALSHNGHLRGSGQIQYDAYSILRIDKADHPQDPSLQWRVDNLIYAINIDKQRFGPPAETQYLQLIGSEGKLTENMER